MNISPRACRQLLSYTSDVLIAGASFSDGPQEDRTVEGAHASRSPFAATTPHYRPPDPTTSTIGSSSSSTYLHVVDRLRTLRTWLLHPGGATAVAAYSLPAAVPRVPKNITPSSESPSKSRSQEQRQGGSTRGGGDGVADSSSPGGLVGPESSLSLSQITGSTLSPSGGRGRDEEGASGDGRREKKLTGRRGHKQQQQQHRRRPNKSRPIVDDDYLEDHDDEEGEEEEEDDDEEEAVDGRSLPAGALIAAVLPSRLRGPCASAGPGILVVAGVALSGISFLPEDRGGGGSQSPLLWEPSADETGMGYGSVGVSVCREDGGGGGGSGRMVLPRVLGMRGLLPRHGSQQALAVVWAERPSFQVLDVSRVGPAGVVEEVPLARRHRLG